MGIYDDVLMASSSLVVMAGRALLTLLMLLSNKGGSRPRHLQGKGVNTRLVRQALGFPFFFGLM